jgi:hypothetical protein
MDINKFINENLDDILNNADEYISKPINNDKKKVSWKEEIEESSKILDNQNEDELTNEELQGELFEKYYNKITEKEYLKSIGEYNSDEDEKEDKEDTNEENISEYKISLLNLFLIHYNEKYEKCENYFSNIKNIEKDTSNSMELFFEALVEFKKIKEELKYEEDEECMDYYFEESDDKNIIEMFDKFPEGQMYCLDYNNKRIISPSILVCLNYLINNKEDLFENKNWNIFNLRDN